MWVEDVLGALAVKALALDCQMLLQVSLILSQVSGSSRYIAVIADMVRPSAKERMATQLEYQISMIRTLSSVQDVLVTTTLKE